MPDLHALDPLLLLGVAAALILVQTAFVIGFLVPAGKAAVLAGVLAGAGHLDPLLTYGALASSAIFGACIGYLLGQRFGDRLLTARLLHPYAGRVERARALAHRRAGFSLLAGRSLAVLRAITPVLAGVVGVSPRRFLVFNVLGGLLWAAVFAGSGFAGGRLLSDVTFNLSTGVVVALIAAPLLITGWLLRVRGVAPKVRPADSLP